MSVVSAGAFLIPLFAAPLAPVRADQAVYTDSLQNAWQNWSWAATDLSSTTAPHAGSDAIAVTTGAWQALYLHHSAFSSAAYTALTFWINGGASGSRSLQVQATLNRVAQPAVKIPAPPANSWALITLPLASLGVAGQTTLDGFWIQDSSGAASATPFYVDDIALTGGTVTVGPATLSVDAAANRHPISPLIYGVAYGDATTLSDLNAPLNRMGGNNTSRYNWQLNADNKGQDWYFESSGDADPTPGGRGDAFIAGSKAGGAQAMLTIPTIGWVATLGPGRGKLPSFSVAKYGAQQSADGWMPDAGNGVHTDGALVPGNDPHDANVPDSAGSEGGWISHLTSKWGTADKGGLRYYILDNEPSIWHSTHRDVHPAGATMDEIKNDILTYGAKIKAADPSALVVAPEEWGWFGYFYSGADQQYGSLHGYTGYPDRAAHGGMDYLPWLLQQVQQHDQAAGQRTLDVFSVHFYPQAGEFSDTVTDSMSLLRNRSTRQLWDPNYTSESWINAPVQLIPRLKGWVNTYYPGTKTALTEYNWGAEGNINGATTQADIFGIFGREGLDMATRWTVPATTSPVYLAMKLFRNYDGHNSGFGDVSISDTAPDPDRVSSFAALRSSDGALTVMVINKGLYTAAPVAVTLANFQSGATAQAWQLTSANAITRLADTALAGNSLKATVPAQSITLFVIPPAAATLANGRFETPSAGNASYVYNPTGGTWIFTGYSGIQSNGSAWYAANAPDGTQTAFLQGYPGRGALGTISQSVTFSAAGSYALTFQAARRLGQVQPLRFSVDGVQVGGLLTPPGSSFAPLTSATFSIGTAGAHTLTLSATDNSGDLSTLVDQVSLSPK